MAQGDTPVQPDRPAVPDEGAGDDGSRENQ